MLIASGVVLVKRMCFCYFRPLFVECCCCALSGVCYWLFVVCCSLCGLRCVFFVVGCSLFLVWCSYIVACWVCLCYCCVVRLLFIVG